MNRSLVSVETEVVLERDNASAPRSHGEACESISVQCVFVFHMLELC